jgi:UDP-N-acetylmuramoyl-tripeptide--D-alanyl-D-alanine ligase
LRLSPDDIAAALQGKLTTTGEKEVTGVSVDTRSLNAGEVFFALKGPNFDGHSFIEQALERGASGVVAERSSTADRRAADETGAFMIQVSDTLQALGDLAALRRRAFDGRVVLITGTNGKTTAKEMTASILGVRWPVFKSPGNYNNLVGVPLSIFGLKEEHRGLVLEAGMNRLGEIGRLTEIASPDVGVITSIAPAHLLYLGDVEGIRKAKGELLEKMGRDGVAVLNADDREVKSLAGKFSGRVVTFAAGPGADVGAERMISRIDGGVSFDLVSPEGKVRISLSFLGLHNIYNALAAAAASLCFDFSLEEIRAGLERCLPLPQRLEMVRLPGGTRIIDDSYNANPGSVRAAVETFKDLVVKGRRFFLLGDMLELGNYSRQAHEEMGRFLSEKGIDFLVTLGDESRIASEVFSREAAHGRKSLHVEDPGQAAAILVEEMSADDLLLIKGSRGMGLERVIEIIKEESGSMAVSEGRGV